MSDETSRPECEAYGCDGFGMSHQGTSYSSGVKEKQYAPCGRPCSPRPERVTLADEIAGEVWAWFNRHDAPWSPSDATVNDLAFHIKGNVLAAREQALREEIAAGVQAAVDLHAQHGHREIVAAMGVLPDLIRGGAR